jgi:hypothetical protein
MVLGIDSTSNRNKYQEYFVVGEGGRCVGLTTLPPSCADCLEIWELHPPEAIRPVQTCTEIRLLLHLYALFAAKIGNRHQFCTQTYQKN